MFVCSFNLNELRSKANWEFFCWIFFWGGGDDRKVRMVIILRSFIILQVDRKGVKVGKGLGREEIKEEREGRGKYVCRKMKKK